MSANGNVIVFPYTLNNDFSKIYEFIKDNPNILISTDLDQLVDNEIIRERSLAYYNKQNAKLNRKMKKHKLDQYERLLEEFEDKIFNYYIENSNNAPRSHKKLLCCLLTIFQTNITVIYTSAIEALNN